MIQPFDFVDNDRTFTCSAEKTQALGDEVWWWFRVSTDDRQRYAPFRADSKDTQKSVKARIVAYYDELLVRRETPTIPPWRRGPEQEQPAAAAPAKKAAPAAAKASAKPTPNKAPAKKPAAKSAAKARKPVRAAGK